MNSKPWFSTSTEAIRWMRDEARQWVDDKPDVAAHLFEAAMMFEKAGLDAKRYRWLCINGRWKASWWSTFKIHEELSAAIDAAIKERS